MPNFWWNLTGCLLWAAGSALFAIAGDRDIGLASLLAGLLFFLGVVVVIIPLVRGRH